MSANPFSRLGYVAIGLETTAGTPVVPSTYVELISEDIKADYGRQSVTGISGKRDAKLRSVDDKVSVTGNLVIIVEPNTAGHFLRGCLGAPTTSTIESGKVYQHIFEPAESLDSYTLDIKKAGETYVRRIFGAYIEKLAFEQGDNKIKCTITFRALGIFDHTRLTESSAASDTTYIVDQTKGLTTSDVLEVRGTGDFDTVLMTHSIASIDTKTNLTVDAKAVATTEGDLLFIKSSTALYTLSDDMVWIGGSTYGVQAEDDNYNAIDNTETADAEDYKATFMNKLEERHTVRGANMEDRFPKVVWPEDFAAEGSLTHYFSTPAFLDDMRSRGKVATRIRHYGKQIDTNSAVAASLTIGSEPGAVTVAADVAGETGSDFNVTIITASDDTLAATKTGNNILVQLANATASKNRANLVGVAIAALSGVISTGVSTTVSVAIAGKANLTGGRNANQKAELQMDFPNVVYRAFSDNLSEENLVNEEIEFDAYFDETESVTTRVVLINAISTYS